MTAGSYHPGIEQDATTASGSGDPRGARPAEHHPVPGVEVHGDDPGPAVGPGPGRPVRQAAGGVALAREGVQGRDHGVQGLVPPAAARQPGTGSDAGMDGARGAQRGEHQPGRAGPQVGARGMRPLVQVTQAGVAERGHRLTALQGGHLVQGHPATQGGCEHAAGAGADDQVDVADWDGQVLLHGVQRPGHPGRAHHPAGSEYHRDARTGPRSGGLPPAAPDPGALAP